jgi:hypothetical protein
MKLKPDPDIRQKANLAAGEMYDLLEKRDGPKKALKRCSPVAPTAGEADLARRHMKEAYRE